MKDKEKLIGVLEIAEKVRRLMNSGIEPGASLVIEVFRAVGADPGEGIRIIIDPEDTATVDSFPMWAWNIRLLLEGTRGTEFRVSLDPEAVALLRESLRNRRDVLKKTITERLDRGLIGAIGRIWTSGKNLEKLVDSFIMSVDIDFLNGNKN